MNTPDSNGSSGIRRPATLTKIGGIAGVSVATVSKVLNGRPGIAPETRRKVEVILNAHGYTVPRQHGGQPAHANLIDILMTVLHDPWAAGMLSAFEREAAERGFDIIPSTTPSTLNDAMITRILSRGTRGIISVFADPTPDQEKRLHGHNLPLVVVGGGSPPTSLTRTVSIDYRAGAFTATQHLLRTGHERIGLVLGDRGKQFNEQRLVGYREALDANSQRFVPELVRWAADFGRKDGELHTHALLDLPEPPSAIIAATDNVAIGVYRAIEARNLSVGSDVSVIGFDNRPEAAWLRPALTTLGIPLEQMVSAALDQLLRLPSVTDVTIEPELILRDSVSRIAQ